MFKILRVLLIWSLGTSFSLENAEIYLGAGMAFIDPEVEDYAAAPFVLNGGYLHHFESFNIGLDLDLGYGGTRKSGAKENLYYWKSSVVSRMDFPIETTELVLPFVVFDVGAFGATLENQVHPAAKAFDPIAGISETQTKPYISAGGGLFYNMKSDNKIGLSLTYGFAKADFKTIEGNPLGFRVKFLYLFDFK